MAQPAGTQQESVAVKPATQSQGRRAASAQRPANTRRASDDEILGIGPQTRVAADSARDAQNQIANEAGKGESKSSPLESELRDAQDGNAAPDAANDAEPANFRAIFDANPDLRRAWHDANAYRETFATPEEAHAATTALADLERMDAMFFSNRPEDHAQLARTIAELDPAAFASLASAMKDLSSANQDRGSGQQLPSRPQSDGSDDSARREPDVQNAARTASFSPAQAEFFHAANAAAVEGVIGAIESQVERLLPEGVSKSARNRVVGEIYRELDTALRSNRQLTQQVREAFRAGALDAEHQRAVVSLITGRARQVLPGVAKRVLNEWTSTIVAASHDRRARQRAAERRVDIAGSGGAGNSAPRTLSPREVDYARMSDADILNL